MRLVLLTHPPSLGSASMPRFAEMIQRGMVARGHAAEVWTSQPKLARLPVRSGFIRKWLGYGDQFLFYPRELARRVAQQPADTLFVVTDQALGMWVPHLAHRPHVIHCHDFLALKSALGEFPENPTGWTGRQYQQLIRKGFSHGQAFISVSEKTREDLSRFIPQSPKLSEVVYNGLNHSFLPLEREHSMSLLKATNLEISPDGIVVHIGGNQWYKNRPGVIAIYHAYATRHSRPPALWMIGAPPTPELRQQAAAVPASGQVHFLPHLTNEQVNAAYAQASVLLFPSLAEGFGWPIAEAMAAGCPVITTGVAPMTEVGGTAARLIPQRPADSTSQAAWAKSAAEILHQVISLEATSRAQLVEASRLNASRFDPQTAVTAYEAIYQSVLSGSKTQIRNTGKNGAAATMPALAPTI